jgi:beta-lactamase superfamily II metal-dependent hydrolase
MPDANIRYVKVREAYLRTRPDPKSKAVNHLLLGDWLRITGATTSDGWVPVRARGDDGWLNADEIGTRRPLEVNFVDIGQGDGCHIVMPDDRVLLIDAGIGDNMIRFLSWRYNLRGRKVKGVAGVAANDPDATDPFLIDTVVMSHPDEDHYGGLTPIFAHPKLRFNRIFHNGIVERPITAADQIAGLTYGSGEDIGGYLTVSGRKYLWELIHSDAEMKALSAQHASTTKKLLTTFRTAIANSPSVEIRSLSVRDGTLPGFTSPEAPTFSLLGPVGIDATFQNETRYCLPKLGSEGESKNGNSVVFRMTFGRLSMLLGGDLNTQSEDHLAREHLGLTVDLSDLWQDAEKLRRKGTGRTTDEQAKWQSLNGLLDQAIAAGRKVFRVDIAKACHHGSHHFTEPFLQMIDATATVISSGDAEPHCHPRPDALGAFGKYGRGVRPLIFSTELARSTREFSPLSRYLKIIEDFQARIAAATSDAERKAIQKEMDTHRDRHVAVYGMITVRTDGELTIIAQKLEEPRGSTKWDIHELVWNPAFGEYEYHPKGGH